MIPHLRHYRLIPLLLLAAAVYSFAGEADIEGKWLSEDGDGWIAIRRDGAILNGYIAGSPDTIPGAPIRLDDKNPDPTLRSRQLEGLAIMQNFRFDGDDRWVGGTIYDPNSGKTYKGTITLLDHDTLKLRGYIGVSLFGRNAIWTRATP